MYICLRKSEQVPYFIINLGLTGDVYLPIIYPSILKIALTVWKDDE